MFQIIYNVAKSVKQNVLLEHANPMFHRILSFGNFSSLFEETEEQSINYGCNYNVSVSLSLRPPLYTTFSVDIIMIIPIIIKITIFAIVTGSKNSYFPLIHLPSCYWTVQ